MDTNMEGLRQFFSIYKISWDLCAKLVKIDLGRSACSPSQSYKKKFFLLSLIKRMLLVSLAHQKWIVIIDSFNQWKSTPFMSADYVCTEPWLFHILYSIGREVSRDSILVVISCYDSWLWLDKCHIAEIG